MQTVIQTSKRLDSFLHEVAQNFELPSNTVVGSIGVLNAVVSDVLTFPLLLLLLLILHLLFLLLIFFVATVVNILILMLVLYCFHYGCWF